MKYTIQDSVATVSNVEVHIYRNSFSIYLLMSVDDFEEDAYVVKGADFCTIVEDEEVIMSSDNLKEIFQDLSVMHMKGRIKKICLRGKWIDVE